MAPDPLSLRLLQAVEALSLRVESHLAELDLSHPLLTPIPEEKAKRAANLETELLGAIDDSEIIASALNQLQNVRDLVLERRQRVQRARAGITALPPEVLQMVFLALVNDHILDPVHQPFCHSAHLLSHVCSEWRQIAIEQSALWRKIDLGLFNENQFELKIERAGPIQPLTLALRVDDVHAIDLVEMIQDHAERWEAIDIFASSCSRSDLSQVFNVLGLSKFSSLRHFSVVGPGRAHAAISREIRFLGSRMPEKQSRHPPLSYLSTSHVRFADFQDIVDTLTTLTTKAASYPPRTWLTVLTRAEMLRYLTITDENLSGTSDPVVTAPITLPQLEKLTLSECSPRTMRFMFRAIHAPELLTVSIDFPFTGRLEGKRARADFEESLDHFSFNVPNVGLSGEPSQITACLQSMTRIGHSQFDRLAILRVHPRNGGNPSDLLPYFNNRQLEAALEKFVEKFFELTEPQSDSFGDEGVPMLIIHVNDNLRLDPNRVASKFVVNRPLSVVSLE